MKKKTKDLEENEKKEILDLGFCGELRKIKID